MSFIIRATLVIGTLSYLALTRDQPAGEAARAIAIPAAANQGLANQGLAGQALAGQALAGLWTSLPEATRGHILQDGAGLIARRNTEPVPPSRDTLADADRQPGWRGIARH